VRPPLVYGPGVRANFLSLLRAVDRGIPLPFGRIDNRRSLVYVENLADLLLTAATADRAAGESYLVSDGAAGSTADLVRGIARALDRPARLVPVPPAALRLAGAVTGRGAAVRRLLGSLEVDGSEALSGSAGVRRTRRRRGSLRPRRGTATEVLGDPDRCGHGVAGVVSWGSLGGAPVRAPAVPAGRSEPPVVAREADAEGGRAGDRDRRSRRGGVAHPRAASSRSRWVWPFRGGLVSCRHRLAR
jgi:hypothetical protein